MKRFQTSASILAALILLLLALFTSKNDVEGRPMTSPSGKAVRDLQINKEMKEKFLRGEKDSYRVIPRTGSSPSYS